MIKIFCVLLILYQIKIVLGDLNYSIIDSKIKVNKIL
jgi:hypothetical protein